MKKHEFFGVFLHAQRGIFHFYVILLGDSWLVFPDEIQIFAKITEKIEIFKKCKSRGETVRPFYGNSLLHGPTLFRM